MPRSARYSQHFLLLLGGLLTLVAATFALPLSPWLVAAISLLVLLITSLKLGLEPVRWRAKSTYLTVILAACLIWWVVQFLLAFLFGLVRQTPISQHLLPAALVIVSSEITRTNLITKGAPSRLAFVLSTLLITLIGARLLLSLAPSSTSAPLALAQFLFTRLTPWLASSLFLSFFARRSGWQPTALYRALTELPFLALPVLTNFGDFLLGVVHLSLPVVCFFLIRALAPAPAPPSLLSSPHSQRTLRATFLGLGLTLAALILLLFSGLFKYYPLAIATGSMQPHLQIGDFVLVQRLAPAEIDQLQTGDILIFSQDDRVIVHRIIAIEHDTTGQPSFTTKGDANQSPDIWPVAPDHVIGLTRFRVPLLGYPTLWLHGQLSGGQL
ncbi:signal peptidase I [Candidatus Saccharibacteria bacterium]|nr:signal peptidase I [Candidatus Saccharibacteria bacterium]